MIILCFDITLNFKKYRAFSFQNKNPLFLIFLLHITIDGIKALLKQKSHSSFYQIELHSRVGRKMEIHEI